MRRRRLHEGQACRHCQAGGDRNVGDHRGPRGIGPRQGAAAPEPHAVDRRFAAALARGIHRAAVQHHLHVIGEPPPAPRPGTAREERIDVLAADRPRRNGLDRRCRSHGQVPPSRVAPDAQAEPLLGECRVDLLRQARGLRHGQLERGRIEQQQPAQVGSQVHGIGAQPGPPARKARKIEQRGGRRDGEIAVPPGRDAEQAEQGVMELHARRAALLAPARENQPERRCRPERLVIGALRRRRLEQCGRQYVCLGRRC